MKMTASKRFTVRTALVTSTTLATIIGAQALAALDEATFSKSDSTDETATQTTSGSSIPVFQSTVQAPAAPNIVILRHASQPNTGSVQSVNPQASAILPPNPVQVTAPQPVVVQPPSPVQVAAPQPAAAPQPSTTKPPRARSSR